MARVTEQDVTRLIEAYESHEGDVDGFVIAWRDYLNGDDTPCPQAPNGLHEVTDGSCDLCGDKNRN